MTRDIRLFHHAGEGGTLGYFDAQLKYRDLEADETLETSVIVSLFTDKRAALTDPLPAGETFRRGWWGDTFAALDGDEIGSHLWLLSREKATQETLNQAKEYSLEALAWLIDDGIAENVQVTTFWVNKIAGVMGITVEITKMTGSKERFNLIWNRLLQGEPSTAVAPRKILSLETNQDFLATDDNQFLEQ